jgi:PAS domain S-box-containing protein
LFRKINFSRLFKNYFVYLSVFTIEVIIVVAYFTWKNKEILIKSALIDNFHVSETLQPEVDALLEAYRSTISHYYLMAGIVIISVIIMAVLIHILMKKRINDIGRLNYLEDLSKNSEQILKNETKYRSLFENNGTAILVVGDDELISDCNGKFAELMGYSREEMVNRMHWEKIVHRDDIERVKGYDALRRTDAQKAPTEYLMKLIKKDGSVRQVIVTVIVLHGTEQLASIVDITAMLEKDRQLKENQELLRQAQEIASMGSWTYFLNSKELQVSDEFISMLDLKGFDGSISLDSLRDKLRFEQFYRTVTGMIQNLSQCDTEITYLETREGFPKKTFYFKIKGRVISEEGKPVKLIGILQDITDRKSIENEINRTNKDLKNLLYVASHDLQIPLISIEGFASLLLNSTEGKDIDQVTRSYLERIFHNTKQMSGLFKNFFDMSRSAGARNSFELFNSHELIKRVIGDNKLLTDKYGADIKIAEESGIPDIYGDRENIRLLFHHLLTNAILYGGKNIFIGYDDNKGFFVKDDGRGIKGTDLEKIFLPGERLEEKNIGGAGMGLTFCRKAADIHNGRIYAESEGINKGSAFYFMPSYELIRN